MQKLRLIVFDVDGTLLKVTSSWQFLHEKLGTWNKGKQHAEEFYQGIITYEEWARLDLEYIARWNLWLDFRILARTVPAVLRGAGAY